MKTVILLLYVMAAMVSTLPAKDEYYDFKIEKNKVEGLLQNPEAIKSYLDCYLDNGPCNELQEFYKTMLPVVIQEACGKCSPYHKDLGVRFFKIFETKFPVEYQGLKKKFDPETKYFEPFLAALKAK